MAILQKRVWMIVGALALFGAGAVALTTPRDAAHPARARRPGAATRTASAAPSRSTGAARKAGEPAAPVRMARLAPAADLAAPAPPAGVPAGAGGERLGSAAAGRNLFRPLIAKERSDRGLPPALMSLDGLPVLPDPTAPGGKRKVDWSYVGTVQLDATTFALLEERKSKAGLYLKVGDTFRGGRVDLIRPEYVAIAVAGRRYALPKSTGMVETPVETAVASATAPAPAPAQPGAQPAAPGQPGQPGGYPPQGYGNDPSRAPYTIPGYPPTDDRARMDEQRQQNGDSGQDWRSRYGRRRRY